MADGFSVGLTLRVGAAEIDDVRIWCVCDADENGITQIVMDDDRDTALWPTIPADASGVVRDLNKLLGDAISNRRSALSVDLFDGEAEWLRNYGRLDEEPFSPIRISGSVG